MRNFYIFKLFFCVIVIICAFSLMIYSNTTMLANSFSVKNKTIIIDAGHGVPDAGAVSKNGTEEKELNLQIAKKLSKLLKKGGATVIMTRKSVYSLSDSKTNNKSEDLKKRTQIRDNSNADMFISIHMNHFGDSRYSGAQVFYNPTLPESGILAKCIQENLISIADPSNSRESKQTDKIFVLKNANIPSVLVECGFLSNEEETRKLLTDSYQQKLAKAIYSGIVAYIKN